MGGLRPVLPDGCHIKLLNDVTKKRLDPAKNLVTSFQVQSGKSSKILPKNLLILWWLKSTYNVTYQFFVFHLHYHCRKYLSWPPHFSSHHYFSVDILSNLGAGYLLFVWHAVFKNPFQMVVFVCTVEQCPAINRLSIASALQLSKEWSLV